jgi:hypothetical protein
MRLVIETRASYGLPSARRTCCCSSSTIGVIARPGSGSLRQHVERRVARPAHERGAVADALGSDQLLRPPTLRKDERSCARRRDHGGEVEGYDEHRAAHPEQTQQRPALVQRRVEVCDSESGQPRLHGEVHGRRVAGVQADEVTGHRFDAGRRVWGVPRGARQAVTGEQTTAPCGDVEVLQATKPAIAAASSTGMSPCTL